MIIDLETDVLRETTETAKRANENIDRAVELLNQVVIHNEWGCSERDEINNYTISNRRLIQELQSKAGAFYNSLCESLVQFEEAEKETATSFQGVDGEIAGVLSMTPGVISDTGSITDIGNYVLAGAHEVVADTGAIYNTPNICNYTTIDKSLNG